MTLEMPRPRAELDQQMLAICQNSVTTMENAVTAILDQHPRDLTMNAMGLLNDALQKIRLANRTLHYADDEENPGA